MKIIVCIKQVPDVTAPIQIKDGVLTMEADRMVLDAYSASAVEEALVITEKYGGQVDVVLVGPERAKETIRKALAMGAESATHILTEVSGLDAAAYATLLAAFLKNKTADVIAVGKQAQDTDSGLTGSMLAEMLGLPYASNAVGLDADPVKNTITVTRQGDSGQEILVLPTPCLVTCSNDMNDPRIPSLKGIMASKKKTIDTITPESLGFSNVTDFIKTTVVSYHPVPKREPGRKFEADAVELSATLTRLLETEAGVL
jgi:electron transfer flavoprotein beta subunit